MDSKIFISHSHEDNQFVEKLAEDIEDSDIECWLDLWELQVGDSIRARIETGIASANWLLVVLSKASVESKWVKQELNMGFVKELELKDVFILPVVRDDCEIPLSLKDKLFADFRHEYADGLNAILAKLKYSDTGERAHFRRLKRYCKKIDEQLPLFAEFFSTFIDAGVPIVQSLDLLASDFREPLRSEIKNVHDLMVEGVTLNQALKSLLDKVPTKRMYYFYFACTVGLKCGILEHSIRRANIDNIEPALLL